jgi:hypothetical protein
MICSRLRARPSSLPSPHPASHPCRDHISRVVIEGRVAASTRHAKKLTDRNVNKMSTWRATRIEACSRSSSLTTRWTPSDSWRSRGSSTSEMRTAHAHAANLVEQHARHEGSTAKASDRTPNTPRCGPTPGGHGEDAHETYGVDRAALREEHATAQVKVYEDLTARRRHFEPGSDAPTGPPTASADRAGRFGIPRGTIDHPTTHARAARM